MLDTLTLYNRDDFIQRYSQSYGWFLHPEKKQKVLSYIRKVDLERVVFVTSTGEFFAYAGTDVQFEFLPITRGWFYGPNGLAFLQRVPAKQFCRGISGKNTRVMEVNSLGKFEESSLSLALLEEVFNPTKQVKPFRSFLDGTLAGYVLSQYFAIIGSRVHFYNHHIGDFKSNEITLNNPLITQELSDTIRRNNLPIKVS